MMLRRLALALLLLPLAGCYVLEQPIITAENALVMEALPGHYELHDAGEEKASLDIAARDEAGAYDFSYKEPGSEETGILRLVRGEAGIFIAQLDKIDEDRIAYLCSIEEGRIVFQTSALSEAEQNDLAAANGVTLEREGKYGPFTLVGTTPAALAFLRAITAGPLEAADGVLVKTPQ